MPPILMRPILAILIAVATFMSASVTAGETAGAEVYQCRIGKPSYCFKYGGNLCEQWNNAPDKPAACERWTAACLDCHVAIPKCLGNVRPMSDAPSCKRCSTRWSSCMKRIDALHWPNRQSR